MDLYNIDTQEQVTVRMCGCDGVRRSNYFGGQPIKRMGLSQEWGSSRMERLQVRMRSQEK